MSKLGPTCQYFVWPPLFSSTALTLLGMEFTRASQVATGVLFHSSMTTSRSWWMLETMRSSTFHLRMPHRCSIVFRSGDMLGQSITFTLSLWRDGIMLCFSMSQYMLAFMVPSMNFCSPVPAALMQPQTMTLPPPCLTVGKTYIFFHPYILRGQQIYTVIQAVHSLLYIVAKCHFFSVVTWKYIIKYL